MAEKIDYIKREDAMNCVNRYFLTGIYKAIQNIPSADVVERSEYDTLYKTRYEEVKKIVFEKMDEITSEERKRGEWVEHEGDCYCSECNCNESEFIYGTEDWRGFGESNFCPNCGAKMKGAAK